VVDDKPIGRLVWDEYAEGAIERFYKKVGHVMEKKITVSFTETAETGE